MLLAQSIYIIISSLLLVKKYFKFIFLSFHTNITYAIELLFHLLLTQLSKQQVQV